MLLAGASVFAVALVMPALGGPRWFGAIAPLGGFGLLAGWGLAAIRLVSLARRPDPD
jgi:uncharacterized membrane protein YgdD (TMEM256/DUF423 family)